MVRKKVGNPSYRVIVAIVPNFKQVLVSLDQVLHAMEKD